MKSLLIAVGGNSLIRAGEKGTFQEQLANARRTSAAIVGLIQAGYHVVVTHGNGPQVGAALLRSERAATQVPSQPLDVCDAVSQGEIGYLLQQCLHNELHAAGMDTPVATILTQSIVSADDAAMSHPSKPIGPFYSRTEAEERKRLLGWNIVEDAARGYRRIVPSPDPTEIVEIDVIRDLVNHGVLVVAAGGGGIPVTSNEGTLHGVEAVIDKDRVSALLASQLGVDVFVISTDTDYVYLDYKKPAQRPLQHVTDTELERHFNEGHFPPGNMGPKIESVLRFLRAGGKEAIITSYEYLEPALRGEAGTHVVSECSVGPLRRAQTAISVGSR